ncbi:hypothetical protein [Streptomyces sp. NPDC059247]|uniref:hypothetical protein n=1 Tax=Streptomyces sp. NPDC059247 TaxID=3346790 RepID=UPI003686BB41
MTELSSLTAQSAAPIPPSSTEPQDSGERRADWDRQLADAFAVLVGSPLDAFDPASVYAVCLGGNALDESGFRQDPAWVRPAVLSGAEPVAGEHFLIHGAVRPQPFDAAGSVFELWVPPGEATALPADFAAALPDVCFDQGLVWGADLAALAERYGVDLADPALAGTWTVYLPRLVSDGTLLDALRVALITGHGPEDLLFRTTGPEEATGEEYGTPYAAVWQEDWEEELAAITHPGLRSHLGYFCTDGEVALMPLGDDAGAGGLEAQGCEAVAGWEDGHGQLDITVIRLGDRVTRPRRVTHP